ncbi:MAG: hypothetical protein WCN87_02265 [Chlamydiota bacterium]
MNKLRIYHKKRGEFTLILLHGYGANGKDLMSFESYVPENVALAFPEGPYDLDQFYMDAKAWFSIDLETLSFDEEQYARSADALLEVVDGLEPSKTIIAGFSQGAMMSLAVALKSPKPFLGVGLFSTTPVTLEGLKPSATRFFQSHGLYDDLLSYDKAEVLFNALIAAGWKGEFVSFPGGHEMPGEVLLKFKEFIHACISG